jgi:hypothetical protein
MGMARWRWSIPVAVSLLALAGCGSSPRLDCWMVDSLDKIFPDDDAGRHEAGGEPRLIARNGHASLQIALRLNDGVAALGVTGPGRRSSRARVCRWRFAVWATCRWARIRPACRRMR